MTTEIHFRRWREPAQIVFTVTSRNDKRGFRMTELAGMLLHPSGFGKCIKKRNGRWVAAEGATGERVYEVKFQHGKRRV